LIEYIADTASDAFVLMALVAVRMMRPISALASCAASRILAKRQSVAAVRAHWTGLPEFRLWLAASTLGSLLLLERFAAPRMRSFGALAVRAASLVLTELRVATLIFTLLVAFWHTVSRMWTIGPLAMPAASGIATKARLTTTIHALRHTICQEVLASFFTAIKRGFPCGRCLSATTVFLVGQSHCPPETVLSVQQRDKSTTNTGANTILTRYVYDLFNVYLLPIF
jgi:hypothetical protein